MVKRKSTDDSRLINRLIANKLIYNFFSYLSYPYLILQLYQLCCFVFISTSSLLATAFCYLLAIAFYLLSALIALSIALLYFLSVVIFYPLSVLTTLSATIFGTRFSHLFWTIPQDLSVMSKIYWIIQFALNHLSLFTYIKSAGLFTILGKFAFKLRGFKVKTI